MIRTWKARIRACVLGREKIYGGSDIVIIARTDALAVEGFDGALQRVRSMVDMDVKSETTETDGQLLAARECGADMGFLEAIETEEQIKTAVAALAPMPVSRSLLLSMQYA